MAVERSKTAVRGIKTLIAGGLGFLATGLALGYLVGVPFLGGFWGGLDQLVAWVILLSVVGYIGWWSDDINVGFVFSFIAVLALVSTVLPSWVTRPFAGISVFLFGQTLGVQPRHLAVLLFATILAYWAIKTRLFGRGKKPAAVTNTVRSKSESLVRQYAKILAAIGGFVVTAVAIFGHQFGDVFGELFTQAASSPVLNTYIATIAGYFAAFFTSLPYISEFGTGEFLVVMLVLFVVGVGAKYSRVTD